MAPARVPRAVAPNRDPIAPQRREARRELGEKLAEKLAEKKGMWSDEETSMRGKHSFAARSTHFCDFKGMLYL